MERGVKLMELYISIVFVGGGRRAVYIILVLYIGVILKFDKFNEDVTVHG